MKKLISCVLTAAIAISCVPVIASASMNIQIGQYVQMGTYYGQPILWRCVDIDENGPLMLSDKIICTKAFDAEPSNNTTTGSHSRASDRQSSGSNYWGDSNMRSWLNSSASAGNVNWLCGNPPIDSEVYYNAYDQEAGFLTNFTQEELNAVKSVTQKSLLSYPEINAGMATTGTEQHYYDSSISSGRSVVTNYDTAYAEYVTDKMFLLDVKQVNAVYNNRSVLGNDYYIGEPTAECVANSEYKNSSLSTGKKWYYWLRSPYSGEDLIVRCVYAAGGVYNNGAGYGIQGVRPAFYLDTSSASFARGDGTEQKPYSINSYNVSFGDTVLSKIPDSVPVIGGGKVGIDIPLIPVNISFDGNKFYGTVGFDVAKFSKNYTVTENIYGNYQEKYDKTNKYLFQNIKKNFTNSVNKWKPSELKKKWKKAMYSATGTMGFESDIMVVGFVEGYIDSNNNAQFLDGGITFNPSYTQKMGSQIWIYPPVFWEASIKGEIEAMLNLYLKDTAKSFTPRGSIGGTVTLKGGVGLGVSGVVGASGGIEGKLGVDYEMYEIKENHISVTGSIGAYAKAFVGPLEYEKPINFAEGTIWEYPSENAVALSLNSIDLYDVSQYKLIDRSYAETPSVFTANDKSISLFGAEAQNKYEQILKTNIYTYSEPQLVGFENGDMLAVWVDDDITRSDINRTSLSYSYYNGTWSEPQKVNDDKTADFAPYLTTINNKAYLIWVNTKTELEDTAEIPDIFAEWDINSAEFDAETKQFINTTAVTNDSYADMTPMLFGDSENIYAVWASNSSNDILGSNNDYSIKVSNLSDGSWAEPSEYASDLYSIDSLDGAVVDGNMNIAYSVDTDGNLDDYSDKEVYLNNEKLTNNEVLDSKVVFDEGNLYWYSDGNIIEYNISENSEKSILPADNNITTDRFKVISNGGNKAIVFGNADGLNMELYAYMYDITSDKWGNSIALTDLNSNINSYSAIFTDSGIMKFVVNKTEITGNIESENPFGQTDLALFTVSPSYNLSVDSVSYAEDTLVKGNTVEFNVCIKNNGELTVDTYDVDIETENGVKLAIHTSSEAILPGETQEIQLYYTVEDDFTPQNAVVKVASEGIDDFDNSDNEYALELTYENIAVENMNCNFIEGDNAVIYGNVVNYGYYPSDNITVELHKDSADGEVIDTQIISDEITSLGSEIFSFTVPYIEEQIYYVTIDADDMKAGDNCDFVVLYRTNYLITFVNYDNSVLQSGDVPEGALPEYTGETPTKPSDDEYHYTFKGWSPEITNVAEETTYTAQFDEAAHTWNNGEITTSPTCTETGIKTFTCTECGQTKTEIVDAIGHNYGAWSITVEPTEETQGEAQRVCQNDNSHIDKITLPVLTDTEVWTAGDYVAPTEEADGSREYMSDYGTVIVTLPSLTHTHEWGNWSIVIEPTLTESGTAERVCAKNTAHKDTVTIPNLSDTAVWTAGTHTEPTCTETGSQEYTSIYGSVNVIIDAKGHDWNDWEVTIAPTCDTEGTKTKTCKNGCGETLTENIFAIGHNYGAWSITVEPTEETQGEAQRVCQNDNSHIDKITLPVLTDTSVWELGNYTAPTEETDGSREYTSNYGTITATIPALSHTHDWGDWSIAIEPTLTENGTAERICTKNSAHKDTVVIPNLSDTDAWTLGTLIEPTEDTDGSQEYTSIYGTVIVIIPSTGKITPTEFSVEYTEDRKAVVSVPKAGTYALIFAAYNTNGVLASVELQTVKFDKVGEQNFSPEHFNTKDADKIKLMLWDSISEMKPLCSTEE